MNKERFMARSMNEPDLSIGSGSARLVLLTILHTPIPTIDCGIKPLETEVFLPIREIWKLFRQ
jgi:two-component system, sensor histidine kinase YesM